MLVFIFWNDITTDTNAIAIYIAGLECSEAKYPECPAAYDTYRATSLKIESKTLAQNRNPQSLDAKMNMMMMIAVVVWYHH